MIFVDTNVINRFLLQDIAEQTKIANNLFSRAAQQEIQLYSTDVVFFEVCWTLKHAYQLEEKAILKSLFDLISGKLITFQNNDIILEALVLSNSNSLGIVDNYNLIYSKTSNLELVTFDKKLKN